MPERRSPLARTGLRVVGDRERVKPPRRRVTGPSGAVRLLVIGRAAGCCEVCGVLLAWFDPGGEVTFTSDYSIHHRQPRGTGGTRNTTVNTPANLMLLHGTGTTGCHGLVESQRALAYTNGWLVRRPTDPATVPALIHPGVRVYLTADGRYTEVS